MEAFVSHLKRPYRRNGGRAEAGGLLHMLERETPPCPASDNQSNAYILIIVIFANFGGVCADIYDQIAFFIMYGVGSPRVCEHDDEAKILCTYIWVSLAYSLPWACRWEGDARKHCFLVFISGVPCEGGKTF